MTSSAFHDAPWIRLLAYGLALVVPPLFAFSLTPSPTLLNELLAICGWGGCLLIHRSVRSPAALRYPVSVLWAGLGVTGAGVVASWALGSLPTSLALPPLLVIVLACVVAALGARVAQEGDVDGLPAFAPFAIGMVIVGVLSSAVALVQVLWPDLPDGDFIARSGIPGRAVGNLRQSNHLASLLIWATIALVPLIEWRRIPRWLGGVLGAWMILGVILSSSRTGLYGGVAILVLWGALDTRLTRETRWMLGASLPVAVLLWFGLAEYLAMGHQTFGAASRLAERDSSHFAIWKNTWSLIQQQPWLGVGWGEFNLAWTLTPFPTRPKAFFDHSHNLPMQLVVELGLPVAAVVLALLVWAAAQGARRAWSVPADAGHGARAAWVMIAMIALHSLDEYPLWYAYFLLPAAWAWGFTLGTGTDRVAVSTQDANPTQWAGSGTALRWVGLLMMVGSCLSAWDYWKVSTIFSDDSGLPSLADRIARGQRSPLFAHHADYADATTAEPPSQALGALKRASHSLIDSRLMIAWANALSESGQPEKARYIVARLREFDKTDAEEFFAPCTDATVVAKPFQCQPEPSGFTWRDFQ